MASSRPLILGVFAFGLILQAAALPIVSMIMFFMSGDNPIIYNGKEVPLREVKARAVIMLSAWFAFALYVGLGLWRGSATARTVIFGVFLVAAIVNFSAYVIVADGVSSKVIAAIYMGVANALVCAIVFWYLYRKPNVRAFFDTDTRGVANAGQRQV